MKKPALAFALFIMPLAGLAQSPIMGSMSCEVKSNYIVGVDDGRATEFNRITGSFSVGDELVFSYFAEPTTQDLSLFLLPHLASAEPIVAWTSTQAPFPSAPLKDMGGFLLSSGRDFMQFGPDTIEFVGVGFFPPSRVLLERYFRSDWQGVVQRRIMLEGRDMALQVFTLDCRQIDERLHDVLTEFEGIDRTTFE